MQDRKLLFVISEVEQYAKDYVDCEEKEYRRMIDEFNEY